MTPTRAEVEAAVESLKKFLTEQRGSAGTIQYDIAMYAWGQLFTLTAALEWAEKRASQNELAMQYQQGERFKAEAALEAHRAMLREDAAGVPLSDLLMEARRTLYQSGQDGPLLDRLALASEHIAALLGDQ